MNEKTDNAPNMILVVDDNQDAALTLGMFLQLKGFATHICYGGQEALDAIDPLHPDLVIMDLAMPEMDGYETASLMRARYASLPLVALSGYGQEEDRRMAREAGFDAHLVKPVDFNALMDLLDEMLPVNG